MAKILWILNKYITGEQTQRYFPKFLFYSQNEFKKKGHELHFVFFSDLLASNNLLKNKIIYDANEYSNLSDKDIEKEANRIEREYEFTFKQSYFADIIQTYKGRNQREIVIPKREYQKLGFLVPKFLYLEKVIKLYKIDVIFSDVSPEVEMEFGRVIGNKLHKLVLKTNEGSAMGRSVMLQLFGFGKDRLVETKMYQFTKEDAESFCNDFISNRRLPYTYPNRNLREESIKVRILNRIYKKDYLYLINWIYNHAIYNLKKSYFFLERNILKPSLYDNFNPETPYLFIGFHLNQESTMALRAQPYTNQTVLVEMISRVLPYNYTLYVRAHPHWPDTYPYSYLSKMKKYPNVKIISDQIPAHDIVKNAKAILTYNATTGIEALIYKKPVLSFASSIYKEHPAVHYCSDLFELGKKLARVVNAKVNQEDTLNYLSKMNSVSIGFRLGSDCFSSDSDSSNKARVFAEFMDKSIHWCKHH